MAVNWKDLLSKVAPTAATLLGGPFAGVAVKFVSDALGLSGADVATVQKVLADGQLSGDQVLALRQAEIALKTHIEDNQLQELVVAAGDRNSARERQVAMKDLTPNIIAVIVLIMAATAYGLLLAGFEPHIAPELVGRILGTLDAVTMLVLSYFYGTNASSARKTEIIAQSTPNNTGNQP